MAHIVHHPLLLVHAGAVQAGQQCLDVLRGVVLQIQQQGLQQLGGLGPRLHHPVADVTQQPRKDLGGVAVHQDPAADVGPLHWKAEMWLDHLVLAHVVKGLGNQKTVPGRLIFFYLHYRAGGK